MELLIRKLLFKGKIIIYIMNNNFLLFLEMCKHQGEYSKIYRAQKNDYKYRKQKAEKDKVKLLKDINQNLNSHK
jgi:hypothetical protein